MPRPTADNCSRVRRVFSAAENRRWSRPSLPEILRGPVMPSFAVVAGSGRQLSPEGNTARALDPGPRPFRPHEPRAPSAVTTSTRHLRPLPMTTLRKEPAKGIGPSRNTSRTSSGSAWQPRQRPIRETSTRASPHPADPRVQAVPIANTGVPINVVCRPCDQRATGAMLALELVSGNVATQRAH